MKKSVFLAACMAALAVTFVGASPAAAAGGGISVDDSVSAGNSSAFSIDTSQSNELILISVDGWPCSGGQQVTVDGSPATLVASAGGLCAGPNSGGATVFQFVAPAAGTHNVAIVDDGGYCCDYVSSFAVSLLNASSTGITSTSTIGPTTPSITTSLPNEYVFATSTINHGGFPGTMAWTGSPVTPTQLQSYGVCCGIDTSIAGFTAPTPGSYSASLSSTSPPYEATAQVTILVAVPLALPTTADQCKKDGWKSFPVFKNQGDCVSFVATGGTNPPANG